MPKPSKEYETFTKLTDRLLSVPRAELQKRLNADKAKAKAAQNPNRRPQAEGRYAFRRGFFAPRHDCGQL
jgi:hypothetical protein